MNGERKAWFVAAAWALFDALDASRAHEGAAQVVIAVISAIACVVVGVAAKSEKGRQP